MCHCALLLAQIQGRFGRRFGVGLGAISGVVSSAILASFRALLCAVWSAIRALFRRLFRALSLAQSGNVSRAVPGAISRSRFVRHFGGVASARHQALNRALFKRYPYVVPFAFAASPVPPLAPPLTPPLVSCLAPSRCCFRASCQRVIVRDAAFVPFAELQSSLLWFGIVVGGGSCIPPSVVSTPGVTCSNADTGAACGAYSSAVSRAVT